LALRRLVEDGRSGKYCCSKDKALEKSPSPVGKKVLCVESEEDVGAGEELIRRTVGETVEGHGMDVFAELRPWPIGVSRLIDAIASDAEDDEKLL
jgi:hypothetical protein